MKKKISMAGLILGLVLATVASMFSGTWIFWLGMGFAFGVVVGTVLARRSQAQDARMAREVKV
jgi:hypothetical protein